MHNPNPARIGWGSQTAGKGGVGSCSTSVRPSSRPVPQSTTPETRSRKNFQNPLDFNFLKRYTSAKPVRGHKYPRKPLLSQRAPHLLRAAQSSCGREWALEGKPNRAARRAVGATESGSVIKAGMCWHITRGRGANPAKIGWHRRSKRSPLLSQCTNSVLGQERFLCSASLLSRERRAAPVCDGRPGKDKAL